MIKAAARVGSSFLTNTELENQPVASPIFLSAPGKVGEPSPVPLGGSSHAPFPFRGFRLPPLRLVFPASDAFRRFPIEQRGFRCGPALFGETLKDDFPFHGTAPDANPGAGSNQLRRLGALVFHMNLTAGNGLRREAPGLEEPGRP